MKVENGTEVPIFLFWEYLFQIFGILSLQCILVHKWVPVRFFMIKIATSEHLNRITGRIFTISVFIEASWNFLLDFFSQKKQLKIVKTINYH